MRVKWITPAMVIAIHDEAIYEFGGMTGIRDAGLLQSAVDRPRNRLEYEPASTTYQLAAALCHGLTKDHPFIDGNKRAALLATRAFLYLNGVELEPEEADEVATMVALAAGSLSDGSLASWLEANSRTLRRK